MICVCACGHVFEATQFDYRPVRGECVAIATKRGKFKPTIFYVHGQPTTLEYLDSVVSADAIARRLADHEAALFASGLPLLLGGTLGLMATPITLQWNGHEAADARIGLASVGGATLLAGILLLSSGAGKRPLDRINELARQEGRCPP
jgi:hypothetical protein